MWGENAGRFETDDPACPDGNIFPGDDGRGDIWKADEKKTDPVILGMRSWGLPLS